MTLLSAAALAGGAAWHVAQLRERNARLEIERATQQRLRGQTLDALNHLVYEVQEGLAQIPGIDEVRQSLLRTALAGLARVVEDSPTADETTTAALVRIGYIQIKLGQIRQASEYFEKARRLTEGRGAADERAPLALADIDRGLALCLGREGRAQESHRLFERARQIAEAHISDDPAQRSHCETLMNICNDLGDCCRELGKLPEARSNFHRSVELGEALPASPATLTARHEVAYAWETLGEMSFDGGDSVAARASFNVHSRSGRR